MSDIENLHNKIQSNLNGAGEEKTKPKQQQQSSSSTSSSSLDAKTKVRSGGDSEKSEKQTPQSKDTKDKKDDEPSSSELKTPTKTRRSGDIEDKKSEKSKKTTSSKTSTTAKTTTTTLLGVTPDSAYDSTKKKKSRQMRTLKALLATWQLKTNISKQINTILERMANCAEKNIESSTQKTSREKSEQLQLVNNLQNDLLRSFSEYVDYVLICDSNDIENVCKLESKLSKTLLSGTKPSDVFLEQAKMERLRSFDKSEFKVFDGAWLGIYEPSKKFTAILEEWSNPKYKNLKIRATRRELYQLYDLIVEKGYKPLGFCYHNKRFGDAAGTDGGKDSKSSAKREYYHSDDSDYVRMIDLAFEIAKTPEYKTRIFVDKVMKTNKKTTGTASDDGFVVGNKWIVDKEKDGTRAKQLKEVDVKDSKKRREDAKRDGVLVPKEAEQVVGVFRKKYTHVMTQIKQYDKVDPIWKLRETRRLEEEREYKKKQEEEKLKKMSKSRGGGRGTRGGASSKKMIQNDDDDDDGEVVEPQSETEDPEAEGAEDVDEKPQKSKPKPKQTQQRKKSAQVVETQEEESTDTVEEPEIETATPSLQKSKPTTKTKPASAKKSKDGDADSDGESEVITVKKKPTSSASVKKDTTTTKVEKKSTTKKKEKEIQPKNKGKQQPSPEDETEQQAITTTGGGDDDDTIEGLEELHKAIRKDDIVDSLQD